MKKIFLILVFFGSFSVFAQKESLEKSSRTVEQNQLFEKAIEKLHKQKYNDAISLLKELVNSEKNMGGTYYYLAQAYYENKQYNECAEACSKGLSIDAKENLLHLYRAQANIALGNTATVCEDLKKSATQDQELLKKYCN
ncbi:tetratricopeptide repeat protein [Flavobacterium sp.]|uniref:tetratricopeptide repeat protein n=1 Tax=Flavobacterium sp. TaxID=239 RepID=UPI003D0AE15E